MKLFSMMEMRQTQRIDERTSSRRCEVSLIATKETCQINRPIKKTTSSPLDGCLRALSLEVLSLS